MKLFVLSMIWFGGIAMAGTTALKPWQMVLLLILSSAALILFRERVHYRFVFAACVIFMLGMLRLHLSRPELGPTHISHYNDLGTRLSLRGTVIDDPDIRDTYIGLRVACERLWIKELELYKPVEGRILVYAPRDTSWHYGDLVRVQGYLETPPTFDTFSYRAYLARQGIHAVIPDPKITLIRSDTGNPLLAILYGLRHRAKHTLRSLYPDPEAALLEGILLGIESDISPKVREAFNRTGTTHIIAISGFNVTILASIFLAGFGQWLGARLGAILAGLAIGFYTIFVGADATVIRAAIMAVLVIIALRIGRQAEGLASLAVAGILMTVVQPQILWDVGFQLSFAATLGLLIYAQPMQNYCARFMQRWIPKAQVKQTAQMISEVFLFTIAAQITTIPLTMYYFRRFSLISFVANPLILPVQPALMILGGITTFVGMVSLELARPLAAISWPLPAYTIHTVVAMSKLPAASIGVVFPSTSMVWLLYAILVILTGILLLPDNQDKLTQLIRRINKSVHLPQTTLILFLILVTGLTWYEVFRVPDGSLHVTLIASEQAESILIQSPDGHTLLINGGPSGMGLSAFLGANLSPTNRDLDALIITTEDREQIGAIRIVAEYYTIKKVFTSHHFVGSTYQEIRDLFDSQGVQTTQLETGARIILGEDSYLEVLAVGESGAVLLLRHGYLRYLLAPGAGPELTYDEVDEMPEKVDVALLPNGGSAAVNPARWLSHLNPRLVLLSIGRDQAFHSPSSEVLRLLEGRTVLRTDLHGSIELISNGRSLWVEVERQGVEG